MLSRVLFEAESHQPVVGVSPYRVVSPAGGSVLSKAAASASPNCRAITGKTAPLILLTVNPDLQKGKAVTCIVLVKDFSQDT